MSLCVKRAVFLLAVMAFLSEYGYSAEKTPDYTPYRASEFPGWVHDMRRFEIIFFGTLPFSFFYATAGYSLYTYASHNWDSAYAPALFGNRTPPLRTNSEKLEIIGVSLSLSAVAALTDFIIGKIRREK